MPGYGLGLTPDDYKDKKNLISKFEKAYGGDEFFKIAINKLSTKYQREFSAFCKYFGYNNEPMTLAAIGQEMNISHSRVSELSKKAFRILIHFKYREEIWEAHGYKPLLDDD
jgi:DNA-directed RNA polymerase sigma subunit (sigma70/sigma32)